MLDTAVPAKGGIPYHWLAFITVAVGTFMGTMDGSITNIALPVLSQIFDAPPELVLWVSLGYTLTFVGIMLTVGRISDIIGRRRLFVAGFLVFTLGLALCSVAQDLSMLVAARVVQALGGAMLVGNANAIVVTAFPSTERGKALGLLEAVVGAGLMVGPSLGGILLEHFDWHALFYIRLPVGLVGTAMAWYWLKDPPRAAWRGGFDFAGAVTLFVGLVALMTAINRGPSWGWGSATTLALGATAVAVLAAFSIIERRAATPVLDFRVFRSRPFAINNGVLFLYFLPNASLPFLIPFFLIQGIGYSSAQAGSFLIIVPFLMLVLSPFTGTLSDRLGAQVMSVSGLVLLAIGLFLLHLVGSDTSGFDVAWRIAVAGLGAGLFLTPTYNVIMGSVPPDQVGVASAIIPTARTVGFAMSLAVCGAILQAQREGYMATLSGTLNGEALVREALTRGVQDTFLVMAAIAVAGVLLCALFGKPDGPVLSGHH